MMLQVLKVVFVEKLEALIRNTFFPPLSPHVGRTTLLSGLLYCVVFSDCKLTTRLEPGVSHNKDGCYLLMCTPTPYKAPEYSHLWTWLWPRWGLLTCCLNFCRIQYHMFYLCV